MAQYVADAMFSRGVKSKYFKMFVSTKDFPHNQKIDEYKVGLALIKVSAYKCRFRTFLSFKERIIKTIESTVKDCATSLFVFDEIDKIPQGLIDTLKAYIDFHQELDGVDFRKSVFIFLRLDNQPIILAFGLVGLAHSSFYLSATQVPLKSPR